MHTQNNIRGLLEKHPIIPVVTFNSMNEVAPVIEKLLSKNIKCIEVTLRTAIAYDSIKLIKTEFLQKIAIGMGTVTHLTHIKKATELGVDFIVSPGINPALFKVLESSKIPFIPGVATPSEIMLGLEQSWDTFKFFPAQLFGGVEALKTYNQVFPMVKFCPTGGITEETHRNYLDLPNVISVGGSWMTK